MTCDAVSQLKPVFRPDGTVAAGTGLSPEIMGLGPVEAIPAALRHAGPGIDDIDLFRDQVDAARGRRTIRFRPSRICT